MNSIRAVDIRPMHARAAIGYACTSAWAVILLASSEFGSPVASFTATFSMLPGLIACLSSIVFFRSFPSISGRTGFVAASALLMAIGTLLYTYPSLEAYPLARIAGLILSGFFAIVVIMSWFDAYARIGSRTIIVLSGCAVSIAAIMCWGIFIAPAEVASALMSILPMLSFVLMPKAEDSDAQPPERSMDDAPAEQEAARRNHAGPLRIRPANPSMLNVIATAVPLRTLAGLAITFFIVSSISALAPEFGNFESSVHPASLVVPLCVTAFFIASAFFIKRHIDPSILYKVLLSAFAGVVFLLAFSAGVSMPLVFYADVTAEIMMWTTLALWAKRTPVKPHLVFAIGWIAECLGRTLGQGLSPVFLAQPSAFFTLAIMLILLAVGFAFSEGSLILDVDFENDAHGSEPHANAAEFNSAIGEGPAPLPSETADVQDSSLSSQATAISASPSEQPSATVSRNSKAPQEGQQPTVELPSHSHGESSTPPSPEDRIAAFCKAHGLSPRERDVFALWVTGHGLKYIENALFVSESTVKSHLRSIYRKCDTHNRAEIIELFEKGA